MELATVIVPTRIRKLGRDNIEMVAPSKIRIQSTGPEAAILLDDGPAQGKQWTATIVVEITETDAP
uniref:Uncharacterized protein n=1 Tax=viral metagenome TaxID=1070528 RepID=A0A6M3XTZ5_9ZZZZ